MHKVPFDYERFRPYFLHVPKEKVRKTFENTTQMAANVPLPGVHFFQTRKSPYPALNVWRRYEPVATDTVFADTPALGTNGHKKAQIFIGRKTRVIDVYSIGSTAEFVNTLEDNIQKRGAMDKLISDSAKYETSKRVLEVLRNLCIDDWQSEPHYQHQNFAEHGWKFLKRNVIWMMNYRNVDRDCWFLCMEWVADVMNHTAEKSLGWRPPLEVLTGQTVDISMLLCFLFWDVVYIDQMAQQEDPDDPQLNTKKDQMVGQGAASEERGRFVGVAKSCGHAMTFLVLLDKTRNVIKRSRLRLAKVGENNLKADMRSGAVPERYYIKSKRADEERLPTIDVATNPFTIEDGLIFEDEPHSNTDKAAGQDDDDESVPDLVPNVPYDSSDDDSSIEDASAGSFNRRRSRRKRRPPRRTTPAFTGKRYADVHIQECDSDLDSVDDDMTPTYFVGTTVVDEVNSDSEDEDSVSSDGYDDESKSVSSSPPPALITRNTMVKTVSDDDSDTDDSDSESDSESVSSSEGETYNEWTPDKTHPSCYDNAPLKHMEIPINQDQEEDKAPHLRGVTDDSNTM